MSRPTDSLLLRPKSVAFQPRRDQRKTIRPFPIGLAKTKWLFGVWNADRDHSPGDQIIQGVLLPSAFSVAPCYYYSTRKPVVILPSHGVWNVESALKVHSAWPRLHITAAVVINTTFRGVIRTCGSSHTAVGRANHKTTATCIYSYLVFTLT